MKSKQYVNKAVYQWRTMFSCGEDTTTLDPNPTKSDHTKSSKRNSMPKATSQWFNLMTNKIMDYGNLERMNTDSTTDSLSEEPAPLPVIDTIRKAKTVPIVIETPELNSIVSEKPTKTEKKTKKKKARPLGPKKVQGRNPKREEFFETVVYDLGYDPADEEDESEQDTEITPTKTQQDNLKQHKTSKTHNDYGPASSSKSTSPIASQDTFSVLTMKEFDTDGNFTAGVIHKKNKENNFNNSQKITEKMMNGIDIKSSIARMRLYKKKQAEQEQRLQDDEIRREQEELLQKRLQQRRREKERMELEEKLQTQLELQHKRDEAKQQQQQPRGSDTTVDTWEDEYSVDDNDDSLNYSVSVMSKTGILKPSNHLAPPSRFVVNIKDETTTEETRGHLSDLMQIAETQFEDVPSDDESAPSDEEDDPKSRTSVAKAVPKLALSSDDWAGDWAGEDWEAFEGGHVFHMGLGKKHYTKWGHYKSSGFKWEEQGF